MQRRLMNGNAGPLLSSYALIKEYRETLLKKKKNNEKEICMSEKQRKRESAPRMFGNREDFSFVLMGVREEIRMEESAAAQADWNDSFPIDTPHYG